MVAKRPRPCGAADIWSSSGLLSRVLTLTDQAIIGIDDRHRVRLFNGNAEQLFQCLGRDAIDQPIETFIVEGSGIVSRGQDPSALPASAVGRRRDGATFPLLVVFNEAAGEGRLIAIAEQAGRPGAVKDASGDSQRLYEALVESIDGIVYALDAETFTPTFVSRHAERILGYPIHAWFEPGFMSDHTHPEDRDWVFATCSAAVAEGKDHQIVCQMIHADGRAVWLRDAATVVTVSDGTKRVSGVMLDVTGANREEETRKRLTAILEATTDFVGFADARDGRVLYLNKAARSGLGLASDSDLSAMHVTDAHPE